MSILRSDKNCRYLHNCPKEDKIIFINKNNEIMCVRAIHDYVQPISELNFQIASTRKRLNITFKIPTYCYLGILLCGSFERFCDAMNNVKRANETEYMLSRIVFILNRSTESSVYTNNNNLDNNIDDDGVGRR